MSPNPDSVIGFYEPLGRPDSAAPRTELTLYVHGSCCGRLHSSVLIARRQDSLRGMNSASLSLLTNRLLARGLPAGYSPNNSSTGARSYSHRFNFSSLNNRLLRGVTAHSLARHLQEVYNSVLAELPICWQNCLCSGRTRRAAYGFVFSLLIRRQLVRRHYLSIV